MALLLEILKYYGLKEYFGKEHNPEIIKMFHEIGYKWVNDDETAWCSAALNYFCFKLGYKRSGKLDARSWLNISPDRSCSYRAGNRFWQWQNPGDTIIIMNHY